MLTLFLNFGKYSNNSLYFFCSGPISPNCSIRGKEKCFPKISWTYLHLKKDWRQGESNLGPLGHELAQPTSKPPSHEAFLLCYLKSKGNPPPQFWQIIQKVPPFAFWEDHWSPKKGEWKALSKNIQNNFQNKIRWEVKWNKPWTSRSWAGSANLQATISQSFCLVLFKNPSNPSPQFWQII